MDEYTKAKLADPTSVAIIDSSTAPVEPEDEAEATEEDEEPQTKAAKAAEAKKDH